MEKRKWKGREKKREHNKFLSIENILKEGRGRRDQKGRKKEREKNMKKEKRRENLMAMNKFNSFSQ